jgi:hypothetical protein
MQKKRKSTKKILSEDEIRNTLFDLIGDELELIYEEPPIENIFIELAFWRASYKIKAKNTSAKATKMARKSNSVKQERISQAIPEIEKAFDDCIEKAQDVLEYIKSKCIYTKGANLDKRFTFLHDDGWYCDGIKVVFLPVSFNCLPAIKGFFYLPQE